VGTLAVLPDRRGLFEIKANPLPENLHLKVQNREKQKT
jgi:hypothetical protein